MKVLIVDDNARYRATLSALLADHFPAIEVAQATNAAEGLAQALSPGLRLVFMDLRFPEGNSFAAMKGIKKACPLCVICVISSYSVPEYRKAAFDNGADRFLAKGASTACEIVAVVESVLSGVHGA